VIVAIAVILALTGTLAALAVLGYNRLRRSQQGVAEAWAQVDTQLQRRYDLVRALNEVVAAAAAHERLALTDATGSRALDERDRAERRVGEAAGRLVATAEAYPSLQADANFRRLHEQLVRTEDDIAASRRYYNGRVRILNTLRETFPWLVMARLTAAAPARYFQIDLDEGQAPRVS